MSDQEKMATNIAIRAAIDGITEIMGDNGTKILFRNINFLNLFENPPDYSWSPCITVREQWKIYSEVEHIVGLNGAIGIWRRIGYTNLRYAVEIGHVLDVMKDLPPDERFVKSLEVFCAASGKGRPVVDEGGHADFDCFDCLLCEGKKVERPMCSIYEGTTQFILDWSYGRGKYIARETKCKGMGDDTCLFTVSEKE